MATVSLKVHHLALAPVRGKSNDYEYVTSMLKNEHAQGTCILVAHEMT